MTKGSLMSIAGEHKMHSGYRKAIVIALSHYHPTEAWWRAYLPKGDIRNLSTLAVIRTEDGGTGDKK